MGKEMEGFNQVVIGVPKLATTSWLIVTFGEMNEMDPQD